MEATNHDLLPDLRRDPCLVLASDYGGEHKESKYHVFAYLIADRPGILRHWDHARKKIRRDFLGNQRRISYKTLGDGMKRRALIPFLKAANTINGLLFCVAFDKSVAPISPSIVWPNGMDVAARYEPFWKPKVWEKLIRVLMFGGVLVGGLSQPGQSLHWITDDDEIIPNDKCLPLACDMAGTVVGHYIEGPMELQLGIAGKFDDEYRAEDLISIVDLAAGAVADAFTSFPDDTILVSKNLLVPSGASVTTKAKLIYAWLSYSMTPLKKIVCLASPIEGGLFHVRFGTPVYAPNPRGLWLPPDKRWRNCAPKR